MRPAYEDVRPALKSKPANELMQSSYVDMISTNIDDKLPKTTQVLTLKPMMSSSSKAEPTLGNSLEKHPTAHERSSMRDQVISKIFKNIGSKQVKRKALELAPPWFVHDSLMAEYDTNWSDAYETVFEKHVASPANFVGSHVV